MGGLSNDVLSHHNLGIFEKHTGASQFGTERKTCTIVLKIQPDILRQPILTNLLKEIMLRILSAQTVFLTYD